MCGIAGILYKFQDILPELDLEALSRQITEITSGQIQADNPPEKTLEKAEKTLSRLREYPAFAYIWNSSSASDKLIGIADSLDNFDQRSRTAVLKSSSPVPTNLIEKWNALWVRLRDASWLIRRDVLGNIAKVKLIVPENLQASPSIDAWKITAVINNIDRLEVRGRDSLGISVGVTFQSRKTYDDFCSSIKAAGLWEEYAKRSRNALLDNLSLRIDEHSDLCSIMFVYKVSQEVGALGDNAAAIRKSIKEDSLLWAALTSKDVFTNVWSHTRWASNGVISLPNCHPVDEQTEPAQKHHYWTAAALNGDVDNFQTIGTKIFNASGKSISSKITTDAKIIPVLTDYNYQRCGSLQESFIQAVREFEGSVAVCLSSSISPNLTYLALKGSGQSLFIGICEYGYVFASEVYGLVEQTSRYIRLNGALERIPGHPETAGQIFIIDQNKTGLDGIKAFNIDGTELEITEKDIKTAEITTRDINRGEHSHFLLKEIFDAPNSIAKTLQGKYFISDKLDGEASINLGPEVFPESLTEKFAQNSINRIMLIGQGTAAVAGTAIASMMQRTLKGTGIEIRAIKATELSGYAMEQDMSRTLIIAVSQSGTTTDTNRTVDIVRAHKATVIAIVNRRNSDLTYKADGVMYTSDGRDIEMSVASTKAFYSQVAAGYLIGLNIAQTLKVIENKELRRELQELINLPGKIASVLENRSKIEVLAKRYATTRRDWAVVGSGSTRAAADEIRIKLSELCYKSIATDYIEDKKHIDLSSEPLTLICTAGLPAMALRDSVKEVAIFKSHKSIPIVIASEGFEDFERYASGVIYVPTASANASVLLNTVVGHLWGYYCALSINEGANLLRPARALAVQHLNSAEGLVWNQANIRKLLSIGKNFKDEVNKGRLNSSLSVDSAVHLSSMFQYFDGARSLRQFANDFKGNDLVKTMLLFLSQAIQELSRPIDAIKHQAKTITVGISRSEESISGPIFEALRDVNFTPDDVPYRDLPFLKAINIVIDEIIGITVYNVDGLNALNEATDSTRIKVACKKGIAKNLRSRADSEAPLVGTKQWVVNNKRSHIGHGGNDKRAMLIIPIVSGGRADHLALLHLKFKTQLSLEKRLEVIKNLTSRYGDLVTQVEETNLIWHDEFLNLLTVEELATERSANLAQMIISRQ